MIACARGVRPCKVHLDRQVRLVREDMRYAVNALIWKRKDELLPRSEETELTVGLA